MLKISPLGSVFVPDPWIFRFETIDSYPESVFVLVCQVDTRATGCWSESDGVLNFLLELIQEKLEVCVRVLRIPG